MSECVLIAGFMGARSPLPGSASARGQLLSSASWLLPPKLGQVTHIRLLSKSRICGVCRIGVLVTDLFRVPRNPCHVRNESLANIKMRAQ